MEQFNDGRYAAVGRAIFRASKYTPNTPLFNGIDVHKLLTESLQSLLPFLNTLEKEQEKILEHSTPDELPTRAQDLQHIKDEAHWVTAAIDLIGEIDKMKKVNLMDEAEIKK